MLQIPVFTRCELDNRLGQPVQAEVAHIPTEIRDYVFISAPQQQAASLVGKNAEHFAFQLCQRLQLDPRRFDLIELRTSGESPCLWRWRFEWVGHTPLSGKSEAVTSASQQQKLFELLAIESPPRAAGLR